MKLADVVSPESLVEPQGRFLADLMGRGVEGTADAVVMPSTTEEVAAVMRWCYANDVPLTARGGGTGLAGGAIPVAGGIVVGFERLNRVRQFDPLLWRMHAEAGVTTGDVQRLARESGLRFPPDPGAPELSQLGGQHRLQRGRPARVQVRRHRAVGDRHRGGGPAGRDHPRGRPAAEGRRRLRPEEPARRLGGDARARHRRVAPADAGARARAARDRRLRRRGCGGRRDRARARLGCRAGGDRLPRRHASALLGRRLPVRASSPTRASC